MEYLRFGASELSGCLWMHTVEAARAFTCANHGLEGCPVPLSLSLYPPTFGLFLLSLSLSFFLSFFFSFFLSFFLSLSLSLSRSVSLCPSPLFSVSPASSVLSVSLSVFLFGTVERHSVKYAAG